MKKNLSFLIVLIIINFIVPLFVIAALPTIGPSIKLTLFAENQNSQTGKWSWGLPINTTNIADGAIINIDIYKNGVKDTATIVSIKSNYAEYLTGSVLDSSTIYKIVATYQGAMDTFEKTTPAGIIPDLIKNGATPVTQTPVPVAPQQGSTTTTSSSVYNLLAPIGVFKVAPDNIGDYFNTIFLIAIGLCGALAVIMIVIGGIQYMGDESIFGKTEAKSRIKSAIFGLLIALGAYALLNTINPALLGGNINIKQVSAEILEPPMLQESTQIPSPGTPINQCSAGIVPISTNGVNMHVCGSISVQVTNLIKTAWAANPQIKLSGAAFRSNADQVKLRTTNNCPDVYTSPAKDCKPPTAIPGTSMHESGLAIDFQCEGQSIQTKDNKCFIWLLQNAGAFGLINFSKEPWHWSTTGT